MGEVQSIKLQLKSQKKKKRFFSVRACKRVYGIHVELSDCLSLQAHSDRQESVCSADGEDFSKSPTPVLQTSGGKQQPNSFWLAILALVNDLLVCYIHSENYFCLCYDFLLCQCMYVVYFLFV